MYSGLKAHLGVLIALRKKRPLYFLAFALRIFFRVVNHPSRICLSVGRSIIFTVLQTPADEPTQFVLYCIQKLSWSFSFVSLITNFWYVTNLDEKITEIWRISICRLLLILVARSSFGMQLELDFPKERSFEVTASFFLYIP